MEIINTIFGIILLCILIPLTIFYFHLYHSVFQVIYFRNTCLEILFEIIGCFIAAIFTLSIIWNLFKYIFGIVGGVIIFLLKAVFILAVVGVSIFVIYFAVKKFTEIKNQKDSK